MTYLCLTHSPAAFVPLRDRAEGEKRAEAVLQADHRHQVSLRRADHPDGRLLGRGPRREARLRPHQDLCGQTQQVRLSSRRLFAVQGGDVSLMMFRYLLMQLPTGCR